MTPTKPMAQHTAAVRSLVLAAALMFWVGGALPANPQVSKLYEDALSRYEGKDYTGAIVQLKNAVALDASDISVQVLLGKALVANGEVAAAEVALGEALRLGVNRSETVLPLARALIAQGKQPSLVTDARLTPVGLPTAVQVKILLLRAGAMADLGDTRGALKTIDEVRVLDANSAESWMAEVPVRLRSKQQIEATAAATKALALAPNSSEALYLRGQVAHLFGDRAAAMSFYDRALKASATHVEALVSRAGLLMDAGKLAEAERDVNALTSNAQTEPRGWYLKSLLAERRGNADETRKALNDVTALLDPVPMEYLRFRPQVLMLGGLAHFGLRQFEKARPYLEAVQRAQPNSPVNKLLAEIHIRDKNLDRALEALESYSRAYPNDAQGLALLASVHMAQGRYARAVQVTQAALKQDDNAALRSMLGMGLLGTRQMSGAVAELEAALKKDPGQLQAGSTLIGIYLQSGQPAKAIRHAETLLQRYPKSAALHYLLGKARAASGDAAGARTAYDQSLQLDPELVAPNIAIARLAAGRGAVDEGVSRLNAILAKDPKNVDAMLELSPMLEHLGKLPDSQRWLEKADDLAGPNNYLAGAALVEFHLRHGRVPAAREALSRVNSKAPEAISNLLLNARVQLAGADNAGARATLNRASGLAAFDAPLLVRIALLQLEAGNLDGAAHALGKAVEARPDYMPATAALCGVEIRQGQFTKAEARIKQVIAKQPQAAIGHALLGDLAAARGQTGAAVAAYRKAQQVEPSTDGLLRIFRAQAAAEPAAASALAEQWLKAHPKDVAVRQALADAQARAGQLAAARSSYEEVIKLQPDNADALNNLANVLIMLNDPTALAVAERALLLRPAWAHVIGTAGWAAFKAGQSEKALQRLRDARLRDPANGQTRFFLASALASVGRPTEARQELQAALSEGATFPSAAAARDLLKTLK